MDALAAASFGDLTPLLAPRSVAVVGASDREGNLGGLAVGFLQKFGYRGPVWPVNSGRTDVAGLPCFRGLRGLASSPGLVFVAVPGGNVTQDVLEGIAVNGAAAVLLAGGFAEGGGKGGGREAGRG